MKIIRNGKSKYAEWQEDINKAYSRLTPKADMIIRQAMFLAGSQRQKEITIHHILAVHGSTTAKDLTAGLQTSETKWTNSPTVKNLFQHAVQLTDRFKKFGGLITDDLVITLAFALWQKETPPGPSPYSIDQLISRLEEQEEEARIPTAEELDQQWGVS